MTTILLFLICFRIVQSGLVAAPMNRAVLVGQWMEMECRTDNGTKVREWTHKRHNTSKIFSNFDTDPNRVAASITNIGVDVDANGSGFIYSNSTSLEEAGLYTCGVEEDHKFFSHTAQLIVLGTDPSCETNQRSDRNVTDAENIWFKCSLEFSGNWAPTMEWRRQCGNKVDLLNGEFVSTVTTNSSVTSTLNLKVLSSDLWCNVSCRTYFSRNNSKINNTIASNTPDYNHSCVWNLQHMQSTIFQYATDASGYGSQVTSEPSEPRDVATMVLIVVLAVVGFVVVMVVVCCLCCACYKKKIADFLIQTAANVQGGSVNCNQQKRISRSKIPLPRRPHSYTKMQILPGQNPTFQVESQLRSIEQPAAVNNETYNIAENEPLSNYATLSRGAQPLTNDSVYERKGNSFFYEGRAESTYNTITDSIFEETPGEYSYTGCISTGTSGPRDKGIPAYATSAKATDGNRSNDTGVQSARLETNGDVRAQIITPSKSASLSIYNEAFVVNRVESKPTDAAITDIDTSMIYDEATDIDGPQTTDATVTDNTYSAITDSVYDTNTDDVYDVVNDA